MKSSSSSVEGGATKKDKPHSLPIPQSKSPLPPLLSATTTTGQGQSRPPPPSSSSYTPFLQFHPSAARRTDTQTSQKEGGDKRPILYVRTSLPPKPRTEETNKKGFLLLFKRVLHDSLLGEKGREMFYCLFQRKNNEAPWAICPAKRE